jgi:hypothetical protein
MKNLRSVLGVLTVLLMATTAQAQQTHVKANVPFDFVVGDRAYPAGEYSLKSIVDDGSVIQIANAQEVTSADVMSHSCSNKTYADKTKLVFRRVGDNYFLYQIWTAGRLYGRELPKSKIELRLARNQEKSELVIVAANISQ